MACTNQKIYTDKNVAISVHAQTKQIHQQKCSNQWHAELKAMCKNVETSCTQVSDVQAVDIKLEAKLGQEECLGELEEMEGNQGSFVQEK